MKAEITEVWAEVPGSCGLYQISTKGRMRSVSRNVLDKRGIIQRFAGGLLSPNKTYRGYLTYTMSINGFAVRKSAHRIVAESFIPNPENKPHVNHLNSNRTDNRVENLEWCTHSENVKHSYKIGVSTQVGTKNSCCKLTEKQVINIFNSRKSPRELCNVYPVSIKTISDIRTGKSWSHITKKYKNQTI